MVTAASRLLYSDLPFPVNPDRESKVEARWRYSTVLTSDLPAFEVVVVAVFGSYVSDESRES